MSLDTATSHLCAAIEAAEFAETAFGEFSPEHQHQRTTVCFAALAAVAVVIDWATTNRMLVMPVACPGGNVDSLHGDTFTSIIELLDEVLRPALDELRRAPLL